jgi:beta-xylosidase
LKYKKPAVEKTWPLATPPDSDEFNDTRLGLQWQWQANPKANWGFPAGKLGFLRLFNVSLPEGLQNFWDVPNLLLQKFPAPDFTVTTKVTFTPRADGDKTGLIVMGLDYAYISIEKRGDGLFISQTLCKDAENHTLERATAGVSLAGTTFYLRVRVGNEAVSNFSFSTDGAKFMPIGESFTARQGRWVGAKVGIFAVGPGNVREFGYADFDWFHIE